MHLFCHRSQTLLDVIEVGVALGDSHTAPRFNKSSVFLGHPADDVHLRSLKGMRREGTRAVPLLLVVQS